MKLLSNVFQFLFKILCTYCENVMMKAQSIPEKIARLTQIMINMNAATCTIKVYITHCRPKDMAPIFPPPDISKFQRFQNHLGNV